MKLPSLIGAIGSLLLTRVFAQTYTDCNPLHTTCPPDPALGTSFNETYGSGSSLNGDYWKQLSPGLSYGSSGAQYQIAQPGDAPTLESTFYIFFGRVEIIMRAASGQGIISSLVLLSDDLDEIDWEIIGGNTTHIETNYYGKGDRSQMNALYYPCDNPQGSFHNYTVVWTSDSIEWHLDGSLVRTVTFDNAVRNGKTMFPQTPCQLKIGNWAGGDPSEPLGVRQWAGGETHYGDGPFNMYVKSVKMTDGTHNSKYYRYGDHSGTYESIDVERGTSKAAEAINAPPPLTLVDRWNALSPTVRIIIICVVGGVAAILLGLFIFYCIRKRRQGKRERIAEEARWEQERRELQEYKMRMHRGDYGMMKTPILGVVERRY